MIGSSDRWILATFLVASTCCGNAHVDAPTANKESVRDSEDAGSWQPLGPPYPDRPGHGATHTESFQLVCAAPSTDPKELTFRIRVSALGDVYVSTANSTAGAETEAHVYVNAFYWRDQKDEYLVDRFSGTLTIKPGPRSYQCEKLGGRKF